MVTYSTYSDLELVDLLKSGSYKAFDEIYRRYLKPLYAQAYRRLGNQDDADDIVQDLFAYLWQKRETLSIKTNLGGYLSKIIRNRILDCISYKGTASKYLQSFQNYIDVGYNDTDHLLRNKQMDLLIAKELATLPAKMREVFEMSRFGCYSHKEIAAKLGISEKTVKSQINNAQRILRPKLGYLVWLYLMILYYSKIFF